MVVETKVGYPTLQYVYMATWAARDRECRQDARGNSNCGLLPHSCELAWLTVVTEVGSAVQGTLH
eukprot:CAMPEP_0181183656 /NCGR_PEP_ID=MMETSP1096-20121128/8542_1 /TAXON_ID=156174 ORGANISM="Chrysochromulina ericina, Strain CCMP281" /NCGR_SAMPLE_ID=MMETSP1096 /ASSEMBLY_ACC=CAM_ASM_000453 /LENGTH=64 /DNA_ID=CAMNT_0023272351 /DNA_START=925 /DNA_END=1119 /DNA_ORIENTATION=+